MTPEGILDEIHSLVGHCFSKDMQLSQAEARINELEQPEAITLRQKAAIVEEIVKKYNIKSMGGNFCYTEALEAEAKMLLRQAVEIEEGRLNAKTNRNH